MERYGQQAAPQVQSTLAKLALCRTAALGGRKYRGNDCQQECGLYNSCGDRHCPQCAGAKRADWIDSTKRLLSVDAVDLRRCYRDHFLAGLSRLRQRGELKLQGDFAYLEADAAWQSLIFDLESTEWVIFIQLPPSQADGQASSAEHVLKYLARYLTGGPIAEGRIIAADKDEVTFWAREGSTPGGDRQLVPITLPTLEFMRRWCLHILPKGYTKTRAVGGWHNRRRDAYLERCAIMLDAIDAPLSKDALEFPVPDIPAAADEAAHHACPSCGGELCLIEFREKPSWHDVMDSAFRPTWYQRPIVTAENLASLGQGTIESAKGKNSRPGDKV